MTAVKARATDFSVTEWFRLDSLAAIHEPRMRMAFVQHVTQGQKNPKIFRDTFADIVVETAVSTARVYGMVFNPGAYIYQELLDDLTDQLIRTVENEPAKESVRNILPRGLPLPERRNRLDVYGLDARSAIHIESLRQRGEDRSVIRQARQRAIILRGNLLGLTEVNRAINGALECLWGENLGSITKASNVRSLNAKRGTAGKQIVTRKDDRVCNYCEPLDGLVVRLYAEFETPYGLFPAPPFHPRCRCFMVVNF